MLKVGECDFWKRRDGKKKIGGQVHCIPFPLPKDEKKKKTKKKRVGLLKKKWNEWKPGSRKGCIDEKKLRIEKIGWNNCRVAFLDFKPFRFNGLIYIILSC